MELVYHTIQHILPHVNSLNHVEALKLKMFMFLEHIHFSIISYLID